MAQVSGIEVSISGNPAGLERALGKAEGSIKKFSGFAKGLIGTLAGGLAVGGFAAAAKSAINFADAVAKTSQKVGASTKALSELNYAAKLSGSSFSELETGMRFLSKSMVNNSELFSQLGISIKNADGSMRSTDEVLMKLADRFQAMPNGAEKTALAMELLGRSGASLIPMLNAGSEGLDKMRDRAIQLGLSISEDTAKRAEKFNDTLTELAAVGQGAMMKLASAMLPVAQTLVSMSVAGAEAMSKLGEAILSIAPYALTAGAAIAGFYAPAVLAGLATTTTAIGVGLVGAIKAVTVAMMANPLGLLVGGIAAAAVAIFAFRDDIKQVFGVDFVGTIKESIDWTIGSFVKTSKIISAIWGSLGDIVGSAIVSVANIAISKVIGLVNAGARAINSLIELANKLPGVMIQTFRELDPSKFQIANNFAPGARSAGQEIAAIMAEETGKGYVDAMVASASGVMSKVSEAFSSGLSETLGGGGGSGGGGGGGGGEKDKPPVVPGVAPSQEVDAFFMSRLESIRNGFMSERELLEAQYIEDMTLLQAHLTGKDELDAYYKDLMLKRAEQHARDMNEIQRAQVQEDLQEVSTGLGSLQSAFQSGNKKMLKAAKIFGVARAVVDTLVAATAAMKTGLTPAQMFANYAMVFAKGMSAVAAIKGVSEGGGGGSGGGGGRGGGGGGAASAAPAAASPTTTFSFTLMNDPMGFGEKFARQFIDQLNSTQRNGGQIRGVIA